MNYLDYLQSPEWRTIRRLKIEEAGGCCQLCSGRRGLEVHHRSYERIFRERMADLIVLCESCHERFHDILPETPAEQMLPPAPPLKPITLRDAIARLEAKRQQLEVPSDAMFILEASDSPLTDGRTA